MRASIFGVTSPLAAQQQSPYFIFSFQFMQARVLVPAMAFVLVFGGVSTTAAAHGALPGEFLYPVKISVNEAVEAALATTPVAKAEVSVKHAVRRVEEAEVLAARGELTAETGEKLAATFEVHAENANDLVGEVEAEDPAAAENLRTKLGSSLEAHGAILATLTVGGAQANQEGAGAVAARVLARSDSAPVATMAMRAAKTAPIQNEVMTMSLSVATDTVDNAATSAEATGTVSLESDMIEDVVADEVQARAAARLHERVLHQLAAARTEFDKNKATLPGSAVTQVSGELVAIEQLVELGSTTLATHHYEEAQSDLAEALKRATKIEVLLRAQSNFTQNIISPILEKALEVRRLPLGL